MEEQNKADEIQAPSIWQSTMDGFSAAQEGFVQHLSDMQGVLPSDMLARDLRKRLKTSVMLFAASLAFFGLAIVLGLPTLLLRPHKFTFCVSIATVLMLWSGIALQGFASFVKTSKQTPSKLLAPAAVVLCTFSTLYVTLVWRSYPAVLGVLCLQGVALFSFLMSFVPGGERGMRLLLRATLSFCMVGVKGALFFLQRMWRYFVNE
jgi:hypothetical protein